MTSQLLIVSRRITDELNDIERAIVRAEHGWREYQTSNDDLYLDSVALNLHGFYNGLEGLFETIATGIDKQLPRGDSWHQNLLKQMANELPDVRPAVISQSTAVVLDEYLRLRHVVRNIYGHQIDVVRLQPLVEEAYEVFNEVSQELTVFAGWLIMN